MKAMILAAGKGTRVQPMTYNIPKPMLPVVRTPVLELIVRHLAKHGVNEIVINTSHLSNEIENYFRDGRQFDVDISYSFEGTLKDGKVVSQALGSAGGLKKIQDFSGFFDETFVVLCGDAIIDLDLGELLRFHKEKNSVATIALKEVSKSEVSKYGVVKTDQHGRIDCFQEKPAPEVAVSQTINTGIYIFEPEIFDHIPSGVEYDIGGELFPFLVEAGIPFYGKVMPFKWVDIGSIEDFWYANRLVLEGQVEGITPPGEEVRPGVFVGINVDLDLESIDIQGPVFIGSGSSIGPGCRIVGPTVIGANSVIEAGAIVEECILDDYTRVRSVGRIRNYMVFDGRCIKAGGEYFEIADLDIGWVVEDARSLIEYSEEQNTIRHMVLCSGGVGA